VRLFFLASRLALPITLQLLRSSPLGARSNFTRLARVCQGDTDVKRRRYSIIHTLLVPE
jgi:hypothetical protein